MRFSTTHQIVTGCLATLVILAILSQIAYRTAQTVEESSALITRAQSVLLYSENLSAQLDRLDQEIRRAAATTGLQRTDDYRRGTSVIQENLELLETFTSLESRHQTHLVRIKQLLESKLASLDRVLDSGATEYESVIVALDISEALTSELHTEVRWLQRVELETLTSATVGGNVEASRARYSILLVSMGAVVFLVIGTALMVGDLRGRREREADLRSSEERFRTVAASAPVGIFLTDTKGAIEYISDSYSAVTGHMSEEVEGRLWTDGVHTDDRVAVSNAWERAVARGDNFDFEYRSTSPDGRVTWIYSRFATLRDADGSVNGFVGTVTDMTESKRTEAERGRFFEVSQDLLAIVDFRGKLHRLNPACSDKLGFSAAQLKALPLGDLVHPDDRDTTEKAWRRLTSGRPITRFENRVRTTNGSYRRLSWNATADMDQKLIYAIGRNIGTSGRSTAAEVKVYGAAGSTESSYTRRNVLVIENADVLAGEITDMLNQNSVGCHVATTGTEAIEIATTERFDAVILDLSLPDVDGKELLALIRGSEVNGPTPVVAIITSSDRRQIPDLHIQGFVEKPVDLRHLNEALWRAGLAHGMARTVRTRSDETAEAV